MVIYLIYVIGIYVYIVLQQREISSLHMCYNCKICIYYYFIDALWQEETILIGDWDDWDSNSEPNFLEYVYAYGGRQ